MQDDRTKEHGTNCVPALFQQSSERIAVDVVKRFLTGHIRVIGLGGGAIAAAVIREISKLPYKENLEFITTSTQIKIKVEECNLRIVDDALITELEIVFDGANQIDKNRNMIKGVGGALLKEKIMHSAAKKVIIMAESKKYVEFLNRPVPIEVHPFARYIVRKKLEELGGQPKLRMLDREYVYVTENGNLILDTAFTSIPDVRKKEVELKTIPGVLEVGLFTRHANVHYKANEDGSFEKMDH